MLRSFETACQAHSSCRQAFLQPSAEGAITQKHTRKGVDISPTSFPSSSPHSTSHAHPLAMHLVGAPVLSDHPYLACQLSSVRQLPSLGFYPTPPSLAYLSSCSPLVHHHMSDIVMLQSNSGMHVTEWHCQATRPPCFKVSSPWTGSAHAMHKGK
jgi:hypothetical protein